MYDRLKRLYDAGMLSITGLANAVVREWIDAAQYEEITGEVYSPEAES